LTTSISELTINKHLWSCYNIKQMRKQKNI